MSTLVIDFDEQKVRGLFALASIPVEYVWELPNQYWPEAYTDLRAANPWWLVKTPHGLIEVGPRKRVFCLKWDHTSYRGVITEDDVTKDREMVHAWSMDKLLQYLTVLGNKLREKEAA